MKGIILAGGLGTRLYPLTKGVSKHLLPIHDKPMIYYSLSVLLLADIKQILIVTTSYDYDQYKKLLGDGSQLGCDFQYAIQNEPNGIPQAFIIGEKFIGSDNVVLVFGDNFFYGVDFGLTLKNFSDNDGAHIFVYEVAVPSQYGIVEFDDNAKPISIEEKPKNSKSNLAITGILIFDNSVINKAKNITLSQRGEYEIVDVIKQYCQQNRLKTNTLNRTVTWFDMGTLQSLYEVSQFVRRIETENNIKIGCIEEIAYKKNYIDKDQLMRLSKSLTKSEYGLYLQKLIN